ncbi:MAG: hypothetical protein JXL84_00590 [Deltaproteobacteria bacterium]|nr:hypothetical protein [Deltaproteobacteria bacterium]
MDAMQDFFRCGDCQNKDFRQVFNFSIKFRTVNFSDELIYDRITDEVYECTRCGRTFTRDEVERSLSNFKRNRRCGT